MKIKIASYKNSKSAFGGLIRFKQKWISGLKEFSKFSHSEIIFCYTDDQDVLDILKQIDNIHKQKDLYSRDDKGVLQKSQKQSYFKKYGLWFSSSEVDGGTRFKFIADNKNNWVIDEYNVSKKQYLRALRYAVEHNNKKYNTLGVIGDQAMGVKWFRSFYNGKKFCSQITTEIMQLVGCFVLKNGIDVMPGELAKMSKAIIDNKK